MKNCTGERCLIQYDKVDPATCKAVGYCPQATPPRTKADCIRAMTDEELADAFMAAEKYGRIHNGQRTKEWWLEWLKQEAEEAANHDAG